MLNVSKAAPGDTTWVQAHNDIQLDWYNNFDVAVNFPDGSLSYRRIYMVFTLGKYQCPGNPQYCGDWDYTVQNFIMTPGGDTLELGRLITPYANASAVRTPWSWKQRYIFDVTDFYPLLKNNAGVRLHYSGYSGGFTANIKFAFIEGTPSRNVLGFERLWHGAYNFGDATDPIDNNITAKTITVPLSTQSTEMKLNITGHGADDQGCSEFCKKHYNVMLNGTQVERKDIWRDDCGSNHLYPQSGTWLYDRGNWCPGDMVFTNVHQLSVPHGTHNLDIDFENYTGTVGTGRSRGSYIVEGAVFYYGQVNKTVDASLEDIIAPSNYEVHFRQNPVTSSPIVRVKNDGGAVITSIKFQYGVKDSAMSEFTWNGSLASLSSTDITLPEPAGLRNTGGQTTAKFGFTCKILEVNGGTDDDATNNTLSSEFSPAPKWPGKLVVVFTTNKARGNNGYSETSWKIVDKDDKVIAQRINNDVNKTYTDTVSLMGGPNQYRLVVEDAGCSGLAFWANQDGTGSLQVREYGKLLGNFLSSGYFNGDFGCGFTQAFVTDGVGLSVEEIGVNGNTAIVAYPNPAANTVGLTLSGIKNVKGDVLVYDAVGRIVLQQSVSTANISLNTSALNNGLYTIVYTQEGNTGKLQTRVLIAK
jgi:hypothetical protein